MDSAPGRRKTSGFLWVDSHNMQLSNNATSILTDGAPNHIMAQNPYSLYRATYTAATRLVAQKPKLR